MSKRKSHAPSTKRISGPRLVIATLCLVAFLAVYLCATRETSNPRTGQTRLAKVAVGGEDWSVRKAAVEQLTDQALLAKIAVEDEDRQVRCAAVKGLTDQTLLAKFALEGDGLEVRQAARARVTYEAVQAKIGRVTDQVRLARIAMEYNDAPVRRAAVEKLTDHDLLVLVARVAIERSDWPVRDAVEKKVTRQAWLPLTTSQVRDWQVPRPRFEDFPYQAALAKIAVEDNDSSVRSAAVQMLDDQTLLTNLAAEAKSLDVRVAAIGKVNHQDLLRQWAEKEPQAAIRQAAVAMIADDAFLAQRLPAERSPAVRAAIVETLRQKDSLRRVALTAYYQEDRAQALRRMQKAFQDPASDVVVAHEGLDRKVKALAEEDDNSKLLAFVLEGEYDVLRVGAARRLSDPTVMEQASLRATSRDVLKILLAKIDDSSILNRIAAGAGDLPMRLAAARRSGAKCWTQIFDAATAGGATVEMLGDALAAVSLFSEVQRDATSAVQQACLNLIRRGDESRIPEMVDLLEGYGDRTLAEDYLNCDQPDLDAQARAWAQRRGYNVGTGAGSRRATWGSGR